MTKLGFIKFILKDIKGYIKKDLRTIYNIKKRYPTLNIEKGVQIKSPEKLKLGENVIIQRNSILHCGGMEWCDFQGEIIIGDHSAISPNNVLYGAGVIHIGHHSATSPGVIITAQVRNYKVGLEATKGTTTKGRYLFKRVLIGDHVSIGSGAIILPGVTIGNNVVIGAGSVVTKDIPSNSLAMGVPAKVVKKLTK